MKNQIPALPTIDEKLIYNVEKKAKAVISRFIEMYPEDKDVQIFINFAMILAQEIYQKNETVSDWSSNDEL